MATSKIISIKSDPTACLDYVKDKTKTIVSDTNLNAIAALKYIVNETKTTHGQNILVDGVGCSAAKADLEFKIREVEYHSQTKEIMKDGKKANQAFHLIQSFSEEDCKKKTPEELHEIGIEFAKRVTGGHFQAVVATHINTLHWHNHIVICAYAQDGPYKFISNQEAYRNIREINDELCKENGLSIIIPQSLNKIANYYEWEQIQNGNSWKEQIRQDIRSTMEISKDWAEFEKIMKNAGYEITFNKSSISYKPPGALHGIRDIRLGNAYTAEYLNQYWEKEQEKKQEKSKRQQSYVNDYVSKYTDTGRKRTFLERIVLTLINKLRKLMNEELDEQAKIQVSYKLQSLIDTHNYMIKNNIHTMQDLKDNLNQIGTEINTLKVSLESINSESFNLEEVLTKVDKYIELKELLEGSGVDTTKLLPEEFSEEEKRAARAEIDPLTKSQKKVLYQALEENPEFKIKYKFSEITREEGREIINYLKGKTAVKSDLIITKEEFNNSRKRINSLKSLEKTPATPSQKPERNKYVMENNIKLKKKVSNKREAQEFLDYIQGNTIKIPSVVETEKDRYVKTFDSENLDIIEDYLKLQDLYYKLDFDKDGYMDMYEERLETLKNEKFKKQLELNEKGKRYRDMKQIQIKSKEILEREEARTKTDKEEIKGNDMKKER